MQAFSVFFLKPYLHIKLSLFFNSLMLYLAVQVPHFHTKLAHFPRLSSPSLNVSILCILPILSNALYSQQAHQLLRTMQK